jgi:hypothetical protein
MHCEQIPGPAMWRREPTTHPFEASQCSTTFSKVLPRRAVFVIGSLLVLKLV